MESFDNAVKKTLSFIDFNNDYVKSGIALFLVLYSGIAAPRLPESIAKLFDYTLVKLLIFFMIVYVARQDPTIAIIASVAVLVSLMTLSTYKFNQEMMTNLKRDEDYEIALRAQQPVVPRYTQDASDGATYPPQFDERSHITGLDEGSNLSILDEAHKAIASLTGDMKDDGHAKYEGKHDLGFGNKVEEKDGYRSMCATPSKTEHFDILGGDKAKEEEKVQVVLAKADEMKRKKQRDLTADELKEICKEVNKKYAAQHYPTDLDSLADCDADPDRDFRTSGNPVGYDDFSKGEDYGSV